MLVTWFCSPSPKSKKQCPALMIIIPGVQARLDAYRLMGVRSIPLEDSALESPFGPPACSSPLYLAHCPRGWPWGTVQGLLDLGLAVGFSQWRRPGRKSSRKAGEKQGWISIQLPPVRLDSFSEGCSSYCVTFPIVTVLTGSGKYTPIAPLGAKVVTDCCQAWTSLNPTQTFVNSPLLNKCSLVSSLSVCAICLQLECWLTYYVNKTWGIPEISFNIYFNKKLLSNYFTQVINTEDLIISRYFWVSGMR